MNDLITLRTAHYVISRSLLFTFWRQLRKIQEENVNLKKPFFYQNASNERREKNCAVKNINFPNWILLNNKVVDTKLSFESLQGCAGKFDTKRQ